MIEQRIRDIEATLSRSERIPPEAKDELIRLLADLKTEVQALTETHRAQADKIAEHAHISAETAVREKKDTDEIETALEGLNESVKEFETSHPRLTETVNRLATMLSNMGI
jgi:cell division septum initiation protein DivIVA